MKELVETLKNKKLTISSCESLTGGMFASSIVNVSGASEVFVGSYVTYMDRCKEVLLDGKAIIESKGAISKEMALKMASVVKKQLGSNIAVSFTGNAGPNPSEGKEVGLVYSCIIINDEVYQYKDVYQGDRSQIRNACINDAKRRIFTSIVFFPKTQNLTLMMKKKKNQTNPDWRTLYRISGQHFSRLSK